MKFSGFFTSGGIGPESLYRTYCGPAPQPENLWAQWNLDPPLILSLGLLVYYSCRSKHRDAGLAAAGVLFIIFISPLCALSSALFSARVVHHVLLFAVAAPLLAMYWPARRIGAAGPAFAISSMILWLWHAPQLYELALSHVGIYWLMQASLLVSAIWYWRVVLDARRTLVESLTLTVAGLTQMGLLGALLTFAPDPLYPAHAIAPLVWGFTPLADQQLAGLIMWVPGILPYVIVGAWRAHADWTKLAGRPA